MWGRGKGSYERGHATHPPAARTVPQLRPPRPGGAARRPAPPRGQRQRQDQFPGGDLLPGDHPLAARRGRPRVDPLGQRRGLRRAGVRARGRLRRPPGRAGGGGDRPRGRSERAGRLAVRQRQRPRREPRHAQADQAQRHRAAGDGRGRHAEGRPLLAAGSRADPRLPHDPPPLSRHHDRPDRHPLHPATERLQPDRRAAQQPLAPVRPGGAWPGRARGRAGAGLLERGADPPRLVHRRPARRDHPRPGRARPRPLRPPDRGRPRAGHRLPLRRRVARAARAGRRV